MRFWDSSAIVPLIVTEADSAVVLELGPEPEAMYVWWGTRVEVAAALSRRARADQRAGQDWQRCHLALSRLAEGWREVLPNELVRDTAMRLLRRHELRAADSLQLAAALVASGDEPGGAEFVTLDERLRRAAGNEGFSLLP
ncbi:MAG: type II toxin-antitoxin system VapC family toxin [Gammaproteobacteria bacterium]|nr:type II toxin-antitoxin system VapC family toxin [Gammaproteobacteria bacterium]